MRFFQDASYKFIEKRRGAYVISAVMIAISLGAILFFQIAAGSWLNYGVDFEGGTLVQVRFAEQTTVEDVRQAVSGRLQGTEITRFGAESEFLVRARQFTEADTNVSELIVELLGDAYGADTFTVTRTEAVGPKVGSELQQKAALAILFSFMATLIYLAFRFEWRFGFAAVIATVHDILLTLGLLAVFRIEVSLPTVAAVLTIIGYSLNDTIIVFDRVRENLKTVSRKEPYISILNRSINEVLPRTVMTSSTTVGALLALYLIGGSMIQDFALVLIFGVLVGTYSSIFVASPALLEIEERSEGETGGRSRRSRRRQRSPARVGA